MTSSPRPTALTLHQRSQKFEVSFEDGATSLIAFSLVCGQSPSAEVLSHGPGREVLQTGKRDVGIDALAVVGHHAVQPTCSEGNRFDITR